MMRALAPLVLALAAITLSPGGAPAQGTPADAPDDADPGATVGAAVGAPELPPLIDRELFFGDPEYAGAQISPDGEWISFLRPYREVLNIWVKRTGEPMDAARPITADTARPVRGYFWTRDSERVLYVQDKGGNENFHIYAVDPDAAEEEETGVPPARDLTPYEGVQARIYAVPEATPGEIVVGLNDRNQQVHDVYRIDLATGERELVIENDEQIAGWQTDLRGRVRLALRQTEDGGTEILRVDGDSLTTIYTCSWRESCGTIRFHRDGERVYMTTNKGDDVDLARLVLLDPETGETTTVESDPEGEVDFGGAIFSDATDELMATVYVGERRRIYPRDEGFARDLERLREALPDGEISRASTTEDESLWIVSVSRDVDPGSVYLYRRESGEAELLYRSRPELPSEHLAHMEAVSYEARDGLEIPAYLTTPRGVEARGLPAVILPHGGPWARDTWGYDAYAQFLANRGYAVLQPNFRGSTGYGKAFLNAGNEEWGTGAMQHDITDGVEWLVDEGIADPDRVGIFGGSYGGYATLAGLAFTPDVYAAGISYVGPSNIITLLESIPPYWKPIQKVFSVRVGDLDDPEDRARLERQSPLNAADAIDDPLLVVQGANDPRVNKRESDQIVVAARENGVPVEYLVAGNEGHGFVNEDNRLALAAAMEEFFAGHLGGRHQEEVSPEIGERLAELRVPVESVTMPEPDTAAAAAVPEPDGSRVRAGELAYTVHIAAGGRTMDVESSRTVAAAERDGRRIWRAVEESSLPAGTSVDTVEVAADDLTPLRRSAGGPFTLSLAYSSDSIVGRVEAQGMSQDVAVALDGPVFGSGPGLELVLASLPLAGGYEATIPVFDVQRGKVRRMRLSVTGTEEVTVPAGTYDTWVVEMTPADGGGDERSLRLMRDAPHWIVRGESTLPGGVTATQELRSVGPESGGG